MRIKKQRCRVLIIFGFDMFLLVSLTSYPSRAFFVRVGIGAVMSIIDLVKDVYIAYIYWTSERFFFFNLTMAMLTTSFFLNFVIIFVQNKGLGWRKMLAEILILLVGLKPAADAMRVASGATMEDGQLLNALGEMSFCKAIELFSESIPAVIIQIAAIAASSDDTSTSEVVPLLVSAISAGFISATISYDMDTDPEQRKNVPEFFGYVPNSAKRRTGMTIILLKITHHTFICF